MDRPWKQFERRLSTFFHTTRTALSGGNGKVTRSDTMHPTLFIEAKKRMKHPIIRTWDKAKKAAGNLIPIVTIAFKGESDMWVLCHCDQFLRVVEGMSKTDALHIETIERKNVGTINLWKNTKELADKEKTLRECGREYKTPLVALQEQSRPGFWIIAHTDDLKFIAQELRKDEVQDVDPTTTPQV